MRVLTQPWTDAQISLSPSRGQVAVGTQGALGSRIHSALSVSNCDQRLPSSQAGIPVLHRALVGPQAVCQAVAGGVAEVCAQNCTIAVLPLHQRIWPSKQPHPGAGPKLHLPSPPQPVETVHA